MSTRTETQVGITWSSVSDNPEQWSQLCQEHYEWGFAAGYAQARADADGALVWDLPRRLVAPTALPTPRRFVGISGYCSSSTTAVGGTMRRHYDDADLNGYWLERGVAPGTWHVVVAGDTLGTIRRRPGKAGWTAYTPSGTPLPHRGSAGYARNRQEAVVDLILGLGMR
jgi:hypothetical protein